MKKLIIPLLLMGAVMFSGCPYDFAVGLSEYADANKNKKNKKLIGDWTSFGEALSKEKINISKGDKTVFHVQHHQYDEEGKKVESFYHRAFASYAGGMELYTLEKKDGFYNIYKVELKSEDEFILTGIEDEYVKANFEHQENTTQQQLQEFLDKHVVKEEAWDEPMAFYRNQSDIYLKKKKERSN